MQCMNVVLRRFIFSFVNNLIPMANVNIDVLYAGSLGIQISFFFLNNFTFYKWCITKVVHCSLGTACLLCITMSFLNCLALC